MQTLQDLDIDRTEYKYRLWAAFHTLETAEYGPFEATFEHPDTMNVRHTPSDMEKVTRFNMDEVSVELVADTFEQSCDDLIALQPKPQSR